MSNQLLAAFQEAYSNLAIEPLLNEKELNKFKVEYGTEVLEELEQLINDSPSGDCKILLTGHRGCGKSTLLAEFSRQMAAQYFVVFFSITDRIERADINHINILFIIAVCLMEEAEKQQIPIDSSLKTQFYQWFATYTRIEKREIGGETSIGLNLFKIIAGKLKVDASIREEIKQEFTRKISDLIAKIDQMASVIQAACKKDIIVIIDDIDKLDLVDVREIFQDHIKALLEPAFRIIYTIPIVAIRELPLKATLDTEFNNKLIFMGVSKLFKKGENRNPNAQPNPTTKAVLETILRKRISSSLVESETLDKIIIYSGGVLRELIRIANECCRSCLILVRRHPDQNDIRINDEILQKAISKISIDFDRTIGKTEDEILVTTYQEFKPDDSQNQKFLNLLHGLCILEYSNARLWYDVHPIVVILLKERGKIT